MSDGSFDLARIKANCDAVRMSCFVLAMRRKVKLAARGRGEVVRSVIARIRSLFRPFKEQ